MLLYLYLLKLLFLDFVINGDTELLQTLSNT